MSTPVSASAFDRFAHSVGSSRAAPRRYQHPPALAGAARGEDADRRSARSRRGARHRRVRVPRGLGRRRLRLGGPARGREPLGADPRAQVADEDAARARPPRSLPRRLAGRSAPTSSAASSPRRPRTESTSSGSTIRSTTSPTCARRARRSSAPGRSSTPASSTARARTTPCMRSSSRRSSLESSARTER